MAKSPEETFILKKFEFVEHLKGKIRWQFNFDNCSEFNLLMGDNAQGKTRFISVLKYFKNLLSNTSLAVPKLDPTHAIDSTFTFQDFFNEDDKVIYKFKLTTSQDATQRLFDEVIKRNGKEIFNREKNILLNEQTGKKIKNFYIPNSTPALNALQDEHFITITALRTFFERMVFFDSFSKMNEIKVNEPIDYFLEPNGMNISAVMDTWKERKPKLFEHLSEVFEKNFEFISKGSITTEEAILFGNINSPLVSFKDKVTKDSINQLHWSSGMLRLLCLLVNIETRFGEDSFPSVVCVDELENALDFKTLKMVLDYYKSRSNLSQIFFTTHSPLVCNMVETKFWRIFSRKGVKVSIKAPQDDPKLQKKRKDLNIDNWEFYKEHIASL